MLAQKSFSSVLEAYFTSESVSAMSFLTVWSLWGNPGIARCWRKTPSQSAPTILKYQVDLIFFRVRNFKKKVQKNRLQKAGCQKTGSLLLKREEAAWPLLFLNNNDPVFRHPVFCNLFFWTFFFRVTNRPMFSKQE